MRAKQAAEPHLSKVVPGTLLDRGCTCPAASFLPAGSPIGMEEEGCKESPGCGTSLSEEPGITGDTSCARAAFTSQESHRRSRQVHPPAPLPKCGGPALKPVSLTLPGHLSCVPSSSHPSNTHAAGCFHTSAGRLGMSGATQANR